MVHQNFAVPVMPNPSYRIRFLMKWNLAIDEKT